MSKPMPMMLAIMGVCSHAYRNRKPCPCDGGVCRAITGSDTAILRCDDCDHLLTEHCDYDHPSNFEDETEIVCESVNSDSIEIEGIDDDVSDVTGELDRHRHVSTTPESEGHVPDDIKPPAIADNSHAVTGDETPGLDEDTVSDDSVSHDDESRVDPLVLTAITSQQSEDEGESASRQPLEDGEVESEFMDIKSDMDLAEPAAPNGNDHFGLPEPHETNHIDQVDQEAEYQPTHPQVTGEKTGSIDPSLDLDDISSPVPSGAQYHAVVSPESQFNLDLHDASDLLAISNPSRGSPYILKKKEVPPCYAPEVLETLPNSDVAFCHPRSETVERLARILDENGVVYVRGPRQTGKTTLARLLQNHYARHKVPAVYISEWQGQGGDAFGYLTGRFWGQGYKNVTPTSLLTHPVVLLLDDAHLSYGDKAFWTQIVKAQSGKRAGLRICLFASHGHPLTGVETANDGQLARFEACQRISSVRPHFGRPNHPQLYYSRGEFSKIVSGMRKFFKFTPEITVGAEDYLYSITNGHPGATDALVKLVFDECSPASGPVTVKSIGQVLKDEYKVLRTLSIHPVQKSFPDSEEMDDNELVKDLFRQIRYDGGMKLDATDYAVDICVKKGWLAGEPKRENGSDMFWAFPSKLHEKYVEHFALDMFDVEDFPSDIFPDLQSLCKTVLGHFSRSKLRSYENEERDVFGSKRSPVHRYKLQFSQILQDLLPFVLVKTNWADGFDDGDFDISIPEMGWGIKLAGPGVCDVPMSNISDPSIKQWLVIAFRKVTSAPFRPKNGMWNVVFGRDYSTIRVFEGYGKPILPQATVPN